MEQAGKTLSETISTAISTSERQTLDWECGTCGRAYPDEKWEEFWSSRPHQGQQAHRLECVPCERSAEAFRRRGVRNDAEKILVRAGFSSELARMRVADVKTGKRFTARRRAEVLKILFSIFDEGRQAKRGICLIGPVGRGKSLLATLAARRYVRRGYDSAAICRPSRLLDKIRDQFHRTNDRRSIEEMLWHYLKAQMLVIDDLGVRRGEATPFEQAQLYRLIDERYLMGARVYTLITTNRTLGDIADDIDQRVASRIAGMCHIIKLDGPDWRVERGG